MNIVNSCDTPLYEVILYMNNNCLLNCNGESLNVISVSIANYISGYFSNDELETLSIVFELIGDALGVIASVRVEDDDKNCTP